MNKNLKKHMDRMEKHSPHHLLKDLEKISFFCNQLCDCTTTYTCNSCNSVTVSNNIAKIIKTQLRDLENMHE